MHEAMQSAYNKYHSTETALLYIKNDILKYIDQHKLVLLVLLELSASFDTNIDHKLLINILSYRLGLSGCVLDRFRSYLKMGHKRSSWLFLSARPPSQNLDYHIKYYRVEMGGGDKCYSHYLYKALE